jgi:hypothetical protein
VDGGLHKIGRGFMRFPTCGPPIVLTLDKAQAEPPNETTVRKCIRGSGFNIVLTYSKKVKPSNRP